MGPRGPDARAVLCGEFASPRAWESGSCGARSRLFCVFAGRAAGRRGRGSLAPSRSIPGVSVPGRPYSGLAHPPPVCAISCLPLLPRVKLRGSAAPPSWEKRGRSSVRDWGCVCVSQTRTLEVRVQGSSLGRDGGGVGVVAGDIPSNLMTQHHLGRLVTASALVVKAQQTHSSFWTLPFAFPTRPFHHHEFSILT